MPICKFYASEGGCARGDKCFYQHVVPDSNDTHKEVGLPRQLPSWRRSTNAAAMKGEPPPIDPLSHVPCRFYAAGTCKNGDACRFSHQNVGQKPGIEPPSVSPSTNTVLETKPNKRSERPPDATATVSTPLNTRELGGSLVEFGDGARVTNIEITNTSKARLQMCNVTCSWYSPSKTATLEFSSSQALNEAKERLESTEVLGRRLECRTAINKRTKPWQCILKIGNLNVSTTYPGLKAACGDKRPKKIEFGSKSYSSTPEEIGQAIQRLLSACGNLEAWTMTPGVNSVHCKATATFTNTEQATKAVAVYDGHRLPQLAGSKIRLSKMLKAKFSILTPMYAAIATDIADVQKRLSAENFLEIKCYQSSDKEQRFTVLHLVASTGDNLGKAKAAVERILRGHAARSATDILWNDFFLKPDGKSYLNRLGADHEVFILRNARKCLLSLYGSEEAKVVVESTLANTLKDLELPRYEIELQAEVPMASHRAGYKQIVKRLGKSAVQLNLTATPQSITIQGSEEDVAWAKATLRDAELGNIEADGGDEDIPTCIVCWDDAAESYTTACDHVYDKECFAGQCASASNKDFPIRCVGDEGKCNSIIALPELEAALTRDQLDNLLERSFIEYVRSNPEKYQYCATAGCDQIYETSADGKVFTCPTCLTTICTSCGVVSHEGLTCEQQKSSTQSDDAFAKWKKENDARDCPKCGCTIQKNEGCNHMTCRVCHVHICWKCMAVFRAEKETYDHLVEQHQGIFEAGYGGF